MNIKEGVKELKRINNELGGDAEVAHGKCDEVLLEFVPKEIKETYEKVRKNVGFWYA